MILRSSRLAIAALILGLGLFSGAHHASAASFDCSKAELPLDKLICATPELSAKDEEMAAKYKAALAILSPEGQGIVKDGQRKWLKFVRTYCTSRIGQPADNSTEDGAGCLSNEYDQRLHQFESVAVKAGQLVFYRVDDFQIWPSAKNDPDGSRSGFGYCAIGYPQIDRPQTPEAKGWNDTWRKWAGKPCKVPDATSVVDANNDIDVDIDINIAQPGFIGITGIQGQYSHGAAHGLPGDDEQWNLLLPSFRELEAADLFEPESGWKKLINDRCKKAISEKLSPEQMSTNRWDDTCTEAGGWVLTPDHLAVSVYLGDDYGYAYGAADAEISWTDLAPYLLPNAPVGPQGN